MTSTATCTLYLFTSTVLTQIPHLEMNDAVTKFWEYNQRQEYPDIAMEVVYCGKKLILIQNTTNLNAIPDIKPVEQGQQPK
jgi:hypothetical protein